MAARKKAVSRQKTITLFINDRTLNPTAYPSEDDYGNLIKKLETCGLIKNLVVKLIINSSGGDPVHAFSIYDAIKRLGLRAHTLAQGEAASAAIIIFLAGEKRFITANSSLMIHRPKVVMSSVILDGAETADIGKELDRTAEKIINIICRTTGQSRDIVTLDLYKGRRFKALEAVAYGLAHKII